MRTWIVALVLLVGCGSGDPLTRTPTGPIEAPSVAGERADVDLDTFAARHAEGVIVLDVRTDAEFQDGHVPGARHVPLQALSADHPVVQGLPRDEPVYVVCATGRRSSQAADMLAAAGYRVVNVQGGTSGWVASGRPVE